MTQNHEPTPEDYARFYRDLAADLAMARRLICSLHAKDSQAVQAIIDQVIDSGRGSETLFATALAALELAAQIVPEPERLQRELDELAMRSLDRADDLARLWPDHGGDAGSTPSV
jgi:hypothetical protein